MKTIYLNIPYNGYTSGTLTGEINNYKHEVQLSSGQIIWLYSDEFQYQ